MVANPGHHATPGGAGVHRHVLADRIVSADFQRRWLALVFQVLRLVSNGGEREDARALTDGRAAINRDMRQEPHSLSEHGMLANHAIRADDDIAGEPGARRYD